MFGIKDMFRTIQFNRFQARYSDLRSRLKHVCTLHAVSTLLRRLWMRMVSSSDLPNANSTGLTAPQATIPDDLIYNVLLRLRFKTVCKFKCVSKSWRTMISSVNFLNDHRRGAGHLILAVSCEESDIVVLCLDTEGTLLDKFTLPGLRLTEHDISYDLVHSCLELVCIHSDFRTFVLNPTTKELFVIPKMEPMVYHEPQTVAFGYIPSIKKYKVIHLIDSECRVFTLGVDRNWRKAPSPPFRTNRYNTAFVDGGIYIFISRFFFKGKSIARFDLEKEVWSWIPDPPMEFSEGIVQFVCELGGKLCFVEKIWGGVYNIWMLKDCNKNLWAKEYELKIPDGFCCYPLVIDEDKRILVRVVVPCSIDRLCYFGINGNICGEIKLPDDGLITTYVESSFSIN